MDMYPLQRPAKEYIRYGTINLDKPAGPTSHEVAAWVKKIMHLSAIGHGGTLDPKVTGVLPITLEDATKVVQAFLYSGKEYVCVMKLHGNAEEERLSQFWRSLKMKFISVRPCGPPLNGNSEPDASTSLTISKRMGVMFSSKSAVKLEHTFVSSALTLAKS